jgi:hypothetical protein
MMVAKKTSAKKAVKASVKKTPAKKTAAKKVVEASAKKTPVARKAPAKKAAPPKKGARRPRLGNADAGPAKIQGEYVEWDNPAEHLEIERRRFAGGELERRRLAVGDIERFAGGLTPTPDLYALAREQWHRMPGVVVRSSMDPVVGDQPSGKAQHPDQAHPDEHGPDQ